MNSKLEQILFWIGTTLCLVGIFLPWEVQGDPINQSTYGVRLFPILEDHGGFELILFIIYHIIGTFKSPQPPEKAGLGYLLSAVLLVISALYFTGRWFLHNITFTGVAGAPAIGMGLVMVLVGSVILVTIAMTKI